MNQRSFYLRVWVPVFLVTQYLALVVVGTIEPDGFDHCVAMPSAGAQAVQAAIACAAVLGVAALAIWRFRGWLLFAALVPTSLAALAWLVLLGGSQSCSP